MSSTLLNAVVFQIGKERQDREEEQIVDSRKGGSRNKCQFTARRRVGASKAERPALKSIACRQKQGIPSAGDGARREVKKAIQKKKGRLREDEGNLYDEKKGGGAKKGPA